MLRWLNFGSSSCFGTPPFKFHILFMKMCREQIKLIMPPPKACFPFVNASLPQNQTLRPSAQSRTNQRPFFKTNRKRNHCLNFGHFLGHPVPVHYDACEPNLVTTNIMSANNPAMLRKNITHRKIIRSITACSLSKFRLRFGSICNATRDAFEWKGSRDWDLFSTRCQRSESFAIFLESNPGFSSHATLKHF